MQMGKCETCPRGTFNDGTWDKCKECHGIIDLERKRCTVLKKHCPAGLGHRKHSNKFCEPCMEQYYNDGSFKFCKMCEGTVVNGNTKCETNNLRHF
jgi:hypothetical protein